VIVTGVQSGTGALVGLTANHADSRPDDSDSRLHHRDPPRRSGPRPRRLYIDWARGLAVLLMIEAHTIDAWTLRAAKQTTAFQDATLLGGFAAPLFLWLAGLAVMLSAARVALRENSRSAAVEAICRRGLEIFILAFLFRLQAFAVTPGSYPVTIFRVDILNIIGPAVVACGLLWGVSRTTARLVIACSVAATVFAMMTPIVRVMPAVNLLPIWLQWYIRPAGDYTTFTMFPWAGFVFAGGASGALIAAAREGNSERRLQIVLGLIGAGLVGLGWYTAHQTGIYRTASFWTTSPTWFAVRVGIMMLALAGLFGLSRIAERHQIVCAPFARLGRSSLFVYWIHVELVYGYATWPLRGRLPVWAALTAWLVFSGLMYGAIGLRDRVVEAWRTRRKTNPGSSAETALA
jgi:uncharacterized membrane protein